MPEASLQGPREMRAVIGVTKAEVVAFPGGKEELSAAALRTSGLAYGDLVDVFFGDDTTDLIAATEAFFAGAAQTLVESDFTDACPIATVALEVASTNEDLRQVCAEVFDDWVRRASARFVQHGIAPTDAEALARVLVMLLEGAFLLSRTLRSTLPLEDAGRTAATEVARLLARSSGSPASVGHDGQPRG